MKPLRALPLVLRRSLVAALVVASMPSIAHAQDAPGDDFLHALDARRYADSWDLSSGYFRQSVSKGEWTKQAIGAREPLGDVASRKLRSSQPESNPPGAPPGEYLLQTYDTTFTSQGAPRTETLPLVRDPDGRWRAVGYFVR